MKRLNLFPQLLLVIIFVISFFSFCEADVNDEIKFISIEKHLKNRDIATAITSKGGHSEECINLNIKNLKDDTLYILIEPGRRIVSYDSTYQDILILKTFEITLAPLASIMISGYGFCCQSTNGSPITGTKFNIGFMSPKTWIRLAKFIDKNNFPPDAIQHAVWVLSDNHPISSIHNEKPEVVHELKKLIADIKNLELPWYSLTFANDTSRLFSNRPDKLWGKIDYVVKNTAVISINVRKSNGTVVKTLLKQTAKGPGSYTYNINLSVINWPKGDYSIYVIEEYSNINTKKNFRL